MNNEEKIKSNIYKKLKKRFIKKLDNDVPNPYAKRKFSLWPLWAKIALPVGSISLAGSIAVAIIVPNVMNKNNDSGQTTSLLDPVGNDQYPVEVETYEPLPNEGILPACAPKTERSYNLQSLDGNFVSRASTKTLESLDNYFSNEYNRNCVLSPASYFLNIASVAAVSDGFDLEEFGLDDPEEDTKTFLESFNCESSDSQGVITTYKSGVLHQQVGDFVKFVDEKREAVATKYIATAVANRGNYHSQAEKYFKENVGIDIHIPEHDMRNNGVITYSALSMVDNANEFKTEMNDFYSEDKPMEVPTAVYGTEERTTQGYICFGSTYTAFSIRITNSYLLIVLPNEGVSLESISISEAYQSYRTARSYVKLYGYIPYFNVSSESVDLTSNLKSKLNNSEKLYSKLIEDDDSIAFNDLNYKFLQSSTFEFNKKGISAQTILSGGGGASGIAKGVYEINVNRPFYAMALRDDFPLFVCKVNNPRIDSSHV